MDEMQKNIKIRSEANAFKFVVGVLIIWILYEVYYAYTNNVTAYFMPSLFLIGTMLVHNISMVILKRRMVADDEEYKEPNKIIWNVVLIVVLTILILVLGSYFLNSEMLPRY
jgi:hypothetical protein